MIRIYTDASISNGRGAWACVIPREGCEPVEYSGPLRGKFRSSTGTELAAIANALHHSRKAGLIGAGDKVIVHCDNEAACGRVNRVALRKPSNCPQMSEIARWVRAFSDQHKIHVSAVHVKGHQAMATVCEHGVFNLRCDELCGAIRDRKAAPAFGVLLGRIAKEKARLASKGRP